MERFLGSFQVGASPEHQVCQTCRWRKVRCTPLGGGSACASCSRLGLPCSIASNEVTRQENGGSPHSHVARPRRLRGSRACITCRRKKARCSGTSPSCSSCRRHNRPCEYPESFKVGAGGAPPQSPSDDEGTHFPAQLGDLVDTYFKRIYPLPSHAFLHPASTKARCRDGKLEPALAFAICALAMWYERPNQQGRDLAESWSNEAEKKILCHLESPTISRLQALLLIISYQMQVGSFQRAFMLIATAARYAVAMRLNYERPDLDTIIQEVRRRVVWSLKIVERYFAVGLPEFEACPIDTIYLQFPGNESGFGCGHHSSDDGTYTLFVKLELIRRDIMKLTRAVALCEQPYHLLPNMMIELKRDLDKIGLHLSTDDDHMLPPGTGTREDNNLSTRKIFARISFHQAHCDLYRILLRDYPEAAPRIVLEAVEASHTKEAQRECLEHASSIVRIMTGLTNNSKNPLILEFDTAICVYHAVRLICFIARFGRGADRPTPEYATSLADLCLVTMRQFFSHSALVQPIIDDMEQLIHGDSPQQAIVLGFASPPEFRDARLGVERHLSEAAQSRQKLAVHSLLRRANFTDEDEVDPYTPTLPAEEPLTLFHNDS